MQELLHTTARSYDEKTAVGRRFDLDKGLALRYSTANVTVAAAVAAVVAAAFCCRRTQTCIRVEWR